jgi:hypothetical protein
MFLRYSVETEISIFHQLLANFPLFFFEYLTGKRTGNALFIIIHATVLSLEFSPLFAQAQFNDAVTNTMVSAARSLDPFRSVEKDGIQIAFDESSSSPVVVSKRLEQLFV